MLTRLSNFLHTRARGRLILALIAAFTLFMGISLPVLSSRFPDEMSLKSLDDPVFYTPGEVFSIIEAWGSPGQAFQLWLHLTWDVVVPVLGFFLFGLSLSWLYQRGARAGSLLRRLNLLALGSGFDLLENFSQAVLIVAYPARPGWIAWLKTLFTLGKYGFLVLIALALLIGLVLAGRNRFKVQK